MEAFVNLEQVIAEGCREMADVYLEIQREFESLDVEVTSILLDCEAILED